MSEKSKLRSVVRAAIVDVPAEAPQCRYFSGRVIANTPSREPQGLHFMLPAGARGLLLSPAAEAGSAELVCAQGDLPPDTLSPGEGGLHFVGTFRVFLAADGTLHLGAQTATDAVALASKVDLEIARLDAAITQLATAVTPIATAVDGTTPGTKETYVGVVAALNLAASPVGSTVVRCV